MNILILGALKENFHMSLIDFIEFFIPWGYKCMFIKTYHAIDNGPRDKSSNTLFPPLRTDNKTHGFLRNSNLTLVDGNRNKPISGKLSLLKKEFNEA